MIPPNEEPSIAYTSVTRKSETKKGSLTGAFATLGFIAFWGVGFMLTSATRGKFIGVYITATILIGLGLLFFPRIRGIGIGILLGLLLAGGLLLLLLAMCGHI